MFVNVEPVLDVQSVGKRFGETWALSDVSFSAQRGELVAVIGPNGAGKTTLLMILAGIRRPDEGRLNRLPSEIGWVPQHAAVYSKLSVKENLQLFARLERVGDTEASIDRMLKQAELSERASDPVERLSGGNRQRVNIAIGLLTDPRVLLLDEPTAALDPRQREKTWRFIHELAGKGTTIIFATHNVEEVEQNATRVVVLADGERLFSGAPRDLWGAVSDEYKQGQLAQPDFESAFLAFLRSKGH